MKIDYSQIITNAISTLLASIVVGAGLIMWNAAMSIDDKITKATNEIKATQDTLISEIVQLKSIVAPEDNLNPEYLQNAINDKVKSY